MSGLTDEAVVEGHDLIENAEHELNEEQDKKVPEPKTVGLESSQAATGPSNASQKESKVDKVKEALHIKK